MLNAIMSDSQPADQGQKELGRVVRPLYLAFKLMLGKLLAFPRPCVPLHVRMYVCASLTLILIEVSPAFRFVCSPAVLLNL